MFMESPASQEGSQKKLQLHDMIGASLLSIEAHCTQNALVYLSIAAISSSITTVFYALSIANYAGDEYYVKTFGMLYGYVNSEDNAPFVWFGLRDVYIKSSQTPYSECLESTDYCKSCSDAGFASFILIAFAILLSELSCVSCIVRMYCPTHVQWKVVGVAVSMGSSILGAIAYSYFNLQCKAQILIDTGIVIQHSGGMQLMLVASFLIQVLGASLPHCLVLTKVDIATKKDESLMC